MRIEVERIPWVVTVAANSHTKPKMTQAEYLAKRKAITLVYNDSLWRLISSGT